MKISEIFYFVYSIKNWFIFMKRDYFYATYEYMQTIVWNPTDKRTNGWPNINVFIFVYYYKYFLFYTNYVI